jgi:hypothetical protein
VIESQRKARSKITWRRTSLGPLRQGQRLNTSETKHAQAKSANHRNRAQTPQRAPPAHMQAPPEPKHTPPEQMQQYNAGMQQRAKTCSFCPGRLDRLYKAVRPPVPHLTAWVAVRPPQETGPAPNCPKFAWTNWNTFQTLLGAQSMHKLLPLVDNAWIKAKCENFQHIASQIYKIQHKELHKSKWASKILYRFVMNLTTWSPSFTTIGQS